MIRHLKRYPFAVLTNAMLAVLILTAVMWDDLVFLISFGKPQ